LSDGQESANKSISTVNYKPYLSFKINLMPNYEVQYTVDNIWNNEPERSACIIVETSKAKAKTILQERVPHAYDIDVLTPE
jgi:hypothetical protein